MTHTRTHVYVMFANWYLTCDRCSSWATGYHDPQRCGCDGRWHNVPCGHDGGVTSVCPSWGPVDGCQCREHLGHVSHAEPAGAQPEGTGDTDG